MYAVGEKVIYGCNGVCTVVEICTPNFSRETRGALYYKLRPLGSSETIYVAVDSRAYMRPVMDRPSAQALIGQFPAVEGTVCASPSITALRQMYEQLLRSHSCEDYIRLMKGVRAKELGGKKLGQTDLKYLKKAESLLYGELAAALEIGMAEVPDYIQTLIGAY